MTSSSKSQPTKSASELRADYTQVHRRRFELSLQWIQPYIEPTCVQILELGGKSPFTDMLQDKALTGLFEGDLREPLFGIEDNEWDMVLCMEVLEHVADTDGLHTEWTGDGVRNLLNEALRILKPGGMLFLTTPNAASITAIHHALGLAPPMVYRPHVREYVPYELDELVRAAGFKIVRRETLDVWRNAISPVKHAAISDFVFRQGYPVTLRGEDIFMLAKKPILETANAGPEKA